MTGEARLAGGNRMTEIWPRPAVLFLCVHNAGRSQMAAGLLRDLAEDRVRVLSAGSEPAGTINPLAVEAMFEKGIDIATAIPQRWTDEMLEAVDVVVTMGCGDTCPVYPGKLYLDWEVADPSGMDLAGVRGVRDELEQRVRGLLGRLAEGAESLLRGREPAGELDRLTPDYPEEGA
jgi:arsenate reductase (thioredoxin)